LLPPSAAVAAELKDQLHTRPVREGSAARIVLVLGGLGIIKLIDAAKGRTVGATTVAWIVAPLLIGAALGTSPWRPLSTTRQR